MSELICGIHTIQSLLRHDPDRFLCIYILHEPVNKRLQLLLQDLRQLNISIQYCTRRYLNNKVQCISHQGVIAKIRESTLFTERDIWSLLEKKFNKTFLLLLILDSITDSRNLGACLRCAGAFGVDMVIVSRHHSAKLNTVVRKVASGSAESIPFIRVTNLARILQILKERDVWVVGTVLFQATHDIFRAKLLSKRLALVMGSEELGIKYLTKRYCDELVNIPMVDSSTSLNVSVATGICLFEVLRRRLYCNT